MAGTWLKGYTVVQKEVCSNPQQASQGLEISVNPVKMGAVVLLCQGRLKREERAVRLCHLLCCAKDRRAFNTNCFLQSKSYMGNLYPFFNDSYGSFN